MKTSHIKIKPDKINMDPGPTNREMFIDCLKSLQALAVIKNSNSIGDRYKGIVVEAIVGKNRTLSEGVRFFRGAAQYLLDKSISESRASKQPVEYKKAKVCTCDDFHRLFQVHHFSCPCFEVDPHFA